MRATMPLIARGGLNRTFGSLAAFVALGFLSLGVYLLADAFPHLLDAEAAGVIVAAFAIAVAMLLFVFIFKLLKFPEIFRCKARELIAQQRSSAPAGFWVTERHDRSRADLPYQRTFVDRSCIRPRKPSAPQARGIAGK